MLKTLNFCNLKLSIFTYVHLQYGHAILCIYPTNTEFLMKSIKIAAIAAVSILAFAESAFAGGTSTTNSYTNRVQHGTGQTQVKIDRHAVGQQVNASQSIKAETYGGTTNISQVKFDGTNLTGSAWSSNNVTVDPVAQISYSSQKENVQYTETQKIGQNEKYNFSQTDYSHTVSGEVSRY